MGEPECADLGRQPLGRLGGTRRQLAGLACRDCRIPIVPASYFIDAAEISTGSSDLSQRTEPKL